MATQIVHGDGPIYIVHVTGTGDTTVDVSALNGVAALDKVVCLKAEVSSSALTDVSLAWVATANVTFASIGLNDSHVFNWEGEGGIRNNAGAGVTGDIVVDVTGTGNFSATLWLRKQA